MPFTIITFIIYFVHLIMAVYGFDQYTDVKGKRKCGDDPNVYQAAIGMCAIWHMIEWNRQALIGFSVLVEVNMIHLYYGLSVL